MRFLQGLSFLVFCVFVFFCCDAFTDLQKNALALRFPVVNLGVVAGCGLAGCGQKLWLT